MPIFDELEQIASPVGYFATTIGYSKRLKRDRLLSTKDKVTLSRSDAVEAGLRMAKHLKLSAFSLVTVEVGDSHIEGNQVLHTHPLRVRKVEYVNAS